MCSGKVFFLPFKKLLIGVFIGIYVINKLYVSDFTEVDYHRNVTQHL